MSEKIKDLTTYCPQCGMLYVIENPKAGRNKIGCYGCGSAFEVYLRKETYTRYIINSDPKIVEED